MLHDKGEKTMKKRADAALLLTAALLCAACASVGSGGGGRDGSEAEISARGLSAGWTR